MLYEMTKQMVSAGLGTRNDLVTMTRKIMREVEKKTTQACISKYSNKDRFQLLTLLACPQHCTAIIYSYTKTNRGFCFCDRVLLPVWEGIKSSDSFSVF